MGRKLLWAVVLLLLCAMWETPIIPEREVTARKLLPAPTGLKVTILAMSVD